VTWMIKPDPSGDYLHPTFKPVELAERAILNSSREGEIVLDCFAGAGFSLIAAHKLKRVWRGIELDPGYCDVIVKRWESYAQQPAARIRPVQVAPEPNVDEEASKHQAMEEAKAVQEEREREREAHEHEPTGPEGES